MLEQQQAAGFNVLRAAVSNKPAQLYNMTKKKLGFLSP
jgi:hypothetical protein